MKRLYLAFIIIAAALAACKQPEDPADKPAPPPGPVDPPQPENVVGPLSVEGSFAEYSFIAGFPGWAEGDAISCFGAGGTHAKLTVKSISGAKATLEGEGDSLGPYTAIYPYSAEDALESGVITTTVPQDQQISSGPIDRQAFPAVAKADGKALSFKNICGLISFEIADEGITGILVQSTSGTPLSGKICVKPATGEITKTEDSSDQIQLKPAGGSFAPGTYFAAILPGSPGELRITLSGGSAIRKAGRTTQTESIPRNGCISAGGLDAANVQWIYELGSYDDLKAWVADRDNWSPSGDTVVLTADINMKDEPWTPLADTYPGVFDGAGHCISHINIQSNTLASVGFFGKGYAKEVKDVTFGSEDGRTYDGTSCIISGYNTTSTSSYWSYTAPIALPAADITNVTNFIPVYVTKGSNRSSRAGGIAAWVTGKVNFTGCRNYGPITIEDHAITEGSSYKYVAAGGILGGQNTESSEVTMTDCHNFAKISSTNHCSYSLGGITGLIYSTAKQFTADSCTNEGDIELLYSATQNDLFAAGGIVGKATCKSGGSLPVVRNCVNKGHIHSEAVHQHYVGGIVGRADGVSITGCRNEGGLEIDHSKQASTRFQMIGGILAAAMGDGGTNSLKDNVNTGLISMKVASSGHNKTPSNSSTFYGVNAGGILGMGGNVSALSGNRNEGELLVENAFSASNSSYPATIHAGGILGYDYGSVENFTENVFSGSVSAATTKATSVPSKVYAGGMVGRLKSATLISGNSKGTVQANTADGSGFRYAGSVAGYNDGTIVKCDYAGTVNGAPADESNIVGGGNLPQGQGDTPGEGGTFAVSETSINFPGTGFTKTMMTVSAGSKDVSITLSGLDWLKTESIPASVAAGKSATFNVVPRTGNIDEKRSGTMTVSENGGETRTVPVSQGDMYTAVNGFPARWEIEKGVTYTEGNAAGQRWLNEGIAATVASPDVVSSAPGTGYISAGSTTGNKLVYSVAPSGTQNISIGNMGEGDYIQFSVPVISLPAGTDVDFMVTINTNNNKTPKYWLFEYWDNGTWNAQPRYTATEDGKTQYSFDVYDYDSKNHRTYITTFRLSKAVEGSFVKMRVRAVGKVNCSGNTLTPTSNAYMNFPCMTYHSCVINAYPGVPAKESTPVKLLQLGNSFTYYNGSAFKLKQICRAEGHATDVRINVKGSQEFAEHLDVLPFSQRVIAEGGYDKAIIQDGSYYHAEYAAGSKSAIVGVTPDYTPEEILHYTKRLSAAIKEKSPNSKVILESVWSYPYKTLGNFLGFGSYENFDAMQWQGSCVIAEADPNIDLVSPIGKAFALARTEYGFTSKYNWLLYTDNYHPHRYGSYLKACVNYLILFGEPFGDHPADCDVPPAEAAKLREVATKIVLGQ
ncbi:MAG: hypothetical protein K6E37_04270 [Bacteroidales bacterium]|nr:hypothetical protein [Bacteroidales bacterium]